MVESEEAKERREAIERSYARLLAQLDWLSTQPGVDAQATARAVAAALRGTPIEEPFPEGSRQNVLWRLAFLWGLRGPWLAMEFLVSGPARLEQVAEGTATLRAGVEALLELERARVHHRPSPLHERLRELVGPEAERIDALWSLEAWTLRPILDAWQLRVRSEEGGRVLDDISDAVAAGVSEAASGVAAEVLRDPDALVARARAALPEGYLELGFIGDVPREAIQAAWSDVEAALQLGAKHVAAHTLRAQLRLLRGDELAEVRSDLAALLEQEPEEGAAYVVLARVEQRAGRPDLAVGACTRALQAARPAADALTLRAVCRAMAGDPRGGEQDARAALAQRPDDAVARYALGETLMYQGDAQGALAAYDDTLAYAPEHPATLLKRAELFAATGQLARALVDADRAVAASQSRDAYYNRGTYRMEAQDLAGAEADFSAALARDPTDIQSMLNRGTLSAMRQDMRAAVVDWSRAADVAPSYAPARLKRAVGRLHLGELDAALLDDLRAALRHGGPDWPQRAEVEALLARCEAQLGPAHN